MSSADGESYTSSFPVWTPFSSFSSLIAMGRTFKTMLNKHNDSRHPFQMPFCFLIYLQRWENNIFQIPLELWLRILIRFCQLEVHNPGLGGLPFWLYHFSNQSYRDVSFCTLTYTSAVQLLG